MGFYHIHYNAIAVCARRHKYLAKPFVNTFSVLLGQEVASYWYSTVRRYNYFKDIGLLHTNVNAGHFTQMVWVKTKYFGIGKATSKTGKIFVVAYYYPAGIAFHCRAATAKRVVINLHELIIISISSSLSHTQVMS